MASQSDNVIPHFQPDGISKIHDLGKVSTEEQKLIDAALPELKKNIEKGLQFVGSS
jgi:malate dehydrogenase